MAQSPIRSSIVPLGGFPAAAGGAAGKSASSPRVAGGSPDASTPMARWLAARQSPEMNTSRELSHRVKPVVSKVIARRPGRSSSFMTPAVSAVASIEVQSLVSVSTVVSPSARPSQPESVNGAVLIEKGDDSSATVSAPGSGIQADSAPSALCDSVHTRRNQAACAPPCGAAGRRGRGPGARAGAGAGAGAEAGASASASAAGRHWPFWGASR